MASWRRASAVRRPLFLPSSKWRCDAANTDASRSRDRLWHDRQLVGIDLETARPVTVHVDHRPFAEFWQAWHDAGFPQPIEYDAEGCMLSLDLSPDGHDETHHG